MRSGRSVRGLLRAKPFLPTPGARRSGQAGLCAVATLALALGDHVAAGPTVGGEGRPAPSRDVESVIAIVLEGYVYAPSGAPAAGAVVVSSAGGKADVDRNGHFQLTTTVGSSARRVELTAVGGAGGRAVAHASATWSTAGYGFVGPLTLERSTSCAPTWLESPGAHPPAGPIHALLVADLGSGPELYAGGTFGGSPFAPRVARWDGAQWSALGGGVTDGDVMALAVFDDGSGPALYVGGEFTEVEGISAGAIARWDGSAWSEVGGGVAGGVGVPASVRALCTYDDGNGPALYATGTFTVAGGQAVPRIARWDGSTWSPLGSGLPNTGFALTVFDEGDGPQLYVGGAFGSAGGVTARRLARWDGSSWSALSSQILGGAVRALAVHDDGDGPALFVGGTFASAGGVSVNHIGRWDGTAWSALGGGQLLPVHALASLDDGGGMALFAGLSLESSTALDPLDMIARWDGASWSVPGTGVTATQGGVEALAVLNAGGTARLVAGGAFDLAEDVSASLASWNGTGWGTLGHGLDGSSVRGLAVFDAGSGPELYAGGLFEVAGEGLAMNIARWDGSGWSALGSGLNGPVRALCVFDDGSGPCLYVGGAFSLAGGEAASNIARWDGATWSSLGTGVNDFVLALEVFDDGSGSALFAGGEFTQAGGAAVDRIARWDGTSWSAVGAGVDIDPGPFGTQASVSALVAHDDGSGPALFVGGEFSSAGGNPALGIARWDGTSWSAVGGGVSYKVTTLALFDAGSGTELYAGGVFYEAGGVPAAGIARWDGSSWSALGDDLGGFSPSVTALRVFDDGDGPWLYAVGDFDTAGGLAAPGFARWDGSSWEALASGIARGGATTLASFDDGTGPALYLGGTFVVDGIGDRLLARWGDPEREAPVIVAPEAVVVLDGRYGTPPGEVVTFAVSAIDDCDPSPLVECVPPSGSVFPSGTTWVTCTATDASGKSSMQTFPVTVESPPRRKP